MKKPIKIVKTIGGYLVYVNGTPVVKTSKGVDFDRAKAGLETPKAYKPPVEVNPICFDMAGDAASIAHRIGRYILGLGDLAFAYTELENIGGNPNTWWDLALR
jgi:hypothetical protein